MKRCKFCWQLPFPEEVEKLVFTLKPVAILAVLPLKKFCFYSEKRRISASNEVLEAIWNNEHWVEILLLTVPQGSFNSSQSTLIRIEVRKESFQPQNDAVFTIIDWILAIFSKFSKSFKKFQFTRTLRSKFSLLNKIDYFMIDFNIFVI